MIYNDYCISGGFPANSVIAQTLLNRAMLNNEETNQNRRTNSGLTERHSNLKGSVPRRESRDPMRALNRNLTADDPIGLTKRLVIVDSNPCPTAH